jgi:hypothetical protein
MWKPNKGKLGSVREVRSIDLMITDRSKRKNYLITLTR